MQVAQEPVHLARTLEMPFAALSPTLVTDMKSIKVMYSAQSGVGSMYGMHITFGTSKEGIKLQSFPDVVLRRRPWARSWTYVTGIPETVVGRPYGGVQLSTKSTFRTDYRNMCGTIKYVTGLFGL